MGRWGPRRSSGAQDRPVPWRFRLGLFLLLPATWLLQLAARAHPDVVERSYSRTVYPIVRDIVSTLTGWFRWSLAEVGLCLLALFLLMSFARALGGMLRRVRTPRNVLAHFVSASLAGAGVLYAWGMIGWGLNYHRRPLAHSAGLDTSPATAEELRRLVESLTREARTLRAMVQENAAGVMEVAGSKGEALARAPRGCEQLGLQYEVLRGSSCSRAKMIVLPLLPWLHVGGVFSMFTSEPNVDVQQPPAAMLDATCHELAHQLGWAREEEASFVGHAACRLHPDLDYRVATTEAALAHALGALGRVDRRAADELYLDLPPAVLRDWEAERRFWDRHRTRVSRAAQRINDAYLRSQGQEAGVLSYGLMVDLLVADQRRREEAR